MRLRIERLPSAPLSAALAARAIALLIAIVVAATVLAFGGSNPIQLGGHVLRSVFGSSFGFEGLALVSAPLILTGLAVAVGQRAGVWNIGGEGQFYVGAFSATAIALFVPGPAAIVLPLMFLGGAIGGAAWILVPALARAYSEVNELITTLLLNFVALFLVYWVATGPWRDKRTGGLAATERLPFAVPELWGYVHWGFPTAVGLALATAAVFAFTKWGYEVRVVGANPENARYAGIQARHRIAIVMLLSGAVAGLAGMLEVAGTVHRLQGGISNYYGYFGIMVAVIARGSFLGVIAGAALLAVILNSGIILQTQGLTTSTVLALTGFVLLLTAIGDELAHYRIRRSVGSEAG